MRRRAFTLVELLVVMGIIAILIAILLPMLSSARKSAQTAACANNLRQIALAATAYIQENRGHWPPAHLDYVYPPATFNLHRWHGTRPKRDKPFVFDGSPLKRYLQTPAIKQCPSFEPSRLNGFEAACGGYGYNGGYIGSSEFCPPPSAATMSLPEWNREVGNRSAKQNMIRRPSEKIAFADAAVADSASSIIEYSFLEPPTTQFGQTSPSIHFRHAGRTANVAWADGHISAERLEWTWPGTNVYGADNARFALGFFGPRDNRLFARD